MQTQSTHKNFRAKGTKRLLTHLAYSQHWPGQPAQPGQFLSSILEKLRAGALKQKMFLITRPEIAQLRLNKTSFVTKAYCYILVS